MPISRAQLPLGIIHFMAYPATIKGEGPVLETLGALVADPDFQLLEVTHIADDDVRTEVAAMLKASGKGYAFGAQPCLLTRKLNLNDPDPAGRQAAVDILKISVDEATEIGASAIAFLAGKDPGAEGRDEAKALLLDSVTQVCAYAQRVNPALKVMLETFDRVPFGKNAVIGPTPEAVAFADQMRAQYPTFSLLLDLSHLPLLGETPEFALTTAKDYLGHIHIGNCVMRDASHPAYGDEHPAFGIAEGENGVAELAEFLRVLDQIGYLNPETPGAVSFEVKPMPGQTSEDVIANAKATIDAAWETLGWPK